MPFFLKKSASKQTQKTRKVLPTLYIPTLFKVCITFIAGQSRYSTPSWYVLRPLPLPFGQRCARTNWMEMKISWADPAYSQCSSNNVSSFSYVNVLLNHNEPAIFSNVFSSFLVFTIPPNLGIDFIKSAHSLKKKKKRCISLACISCQWQCLLNTAHSRQRWTHTGEGLLNHTAHFVYSAKRKEEFNSSTSSFPMSQ